MDYIDYIDEFKESGTIYGWKEGETDDEFIVLMFKDARNQTTLEEKVTIEIDALMKNNNVEHISLSDTLKRAAKIVTLVKSSI